MRTSGAVDVAGAKRRSTWWRAGRSSAPYSRPLVVLGDRHLAIAFAKVAEQRGISARLLPEGVVDLADEWAIAKLLAAAEPWAVVDASTRVGVDDAERDPKSCVTANITPSVTLARACQSADVRLAVFSSDLVFDGCADEPYVEHAEPAPVNVFGYSKAVMEAMLRMLAPSTLVVRPGVAFGLRDQEFLGRALRALILREPCLAAADLVVSPTYVSDLAEATLDLLVDGQSGLWHVANDGATTWAEFVRAAAEAIGVRPRSLVAAHHEEVGWTAPRPTYSALRSERGIVLPTLTDALSRYAAYH